MKLFDLMALVAAVALTLISPAILKATFPEGGQNTWDHRQYVVHLTTLMLFWWTAILMVLGLFGNRGNLRRASRGFGPSALIALSGAFLFLGVRAIAVSLFAAVTGRPQGGLTMP